MTLMTASSTMFCKQTNRPRQAQRVLTNRTACTPGHLACGCRQHWSMHPATWLDRSSISAEALTEAQLHNTHPSIVFHCASQKPPTDTLCSRPHCSTPCMQHTLPCRVPHCRPVNTTLGSAQHQVLQLRGVHGQCFDDHN